MDKYQKIGFLYRICKRIEETIADVENSNCRIMNEAYYASSEEDKSKVTAHRNHLKRCLSHYDRLLNKHSKELAEIVAEEEKQTIKTK